jgi:hypothetical protein
MRAKPPHRKGTRNCTKRMQCNIAMIANHPDLDPKQIGSLFRPTAAVYECRRSMTCLADAHMTSPSPMGHCGLSRIEIPSGTSDALIDRIQSKSLLPALQSKNKALRRSIACCSETSSSSCDDNLIRALRFTACKVLVYSGLEDFGFRLFNILKGSMAFNTNLS